MYTYIPHLNSLSRFCYYQLRQLRTVARSLTPTATATLVHSFVSSRHDNCSCPYTGLPATRLSCLDRVLRSAARLIGRIPKYDHISIYMRDILRWLPARQRIEYRMAALVWRCLLDLAPAYLVEFCGPTQSARSSLSLRSADRGLLRVPFARTSAMQKRAFAVVAPQFGMAYLCRSAHSLEIFLRHSFLNLRRFYLVVLGLGAPLSSPT